MSTTPTQKESTAMPEETDHEHDWQLTEGGYFRSWTTVIDDDGTIHAYYGGADDWSENGDGCYLECLQCTARREVDESEIDWA